MKIRGFMLAAALHGTTIALAFSLMPAQPLLVEHVSLGTVQTQQPAEDPASAELSAATLPPLERPTLTPEAAAPLPYVQGVPEEPRLQELLPDPCGEVPLPEFTEPERRSPRLELPRVRRSPADSPAKRAAAEVESSPEGNTDFTPPALLKWEVPDSFARHFRGCVVALIVVGADSHALSVTLDTGSGDDNIDRELQEALLKGKYSSARKGDLRVESTLRQPIIVK